MSIREWNSIVDQLTSDKIKERSEAVSNFRYFLRSPRNFNAICADSRHVWLTTLQALFNLVITERNVVASKPTAPALKRLEDGATLLQWTVEKVHLHLNRKAVKAVIVHLTQMVALKGKLQSYALIYLRTLRLLLAYTPHLDHLEAKQWTDIVSLCFSALLGDKVVTGMEFDFESETRMEGEDSYEDVNPLRMEFRLENAPQEVPQTTASAVEIELFNCIESAFMSQSAPFLTHSRAIFHKFHRFFKRFPSETTAHAPALVALNRIFAEVDLNDRKSMQDFGPGLWTAILQLWKTKNAGLKEQLVMAYRYLFPFIAPAAGGNTVDAVEDKIKPLYEAILSEPTIRWREGYELDIDSLELGWDSVERREGPTAYNSATFRFGSAFSEKQAVAWTLLELGADTLARLYGVSEGHLPEERRETPEPSGRRKRRKVEEPLSDLVDSLDSRDTFGITVFRLQLITFLTERHWSSLDRHITQRIFQTTLVLLSHESLQIQCWAFIALAAIARIGLPSDVDTMDGAQSQRGSHLANEWEQVWNISLMKLSNPITSRVAAHVANVLLEAQRVDSVLISKSVEALTRDLELQGPNFPSEAVCTFLSRCLAIASNDVRLFRLRLPETVFTWLSTSWKPLDGVFRSHTIGQTRPRADPLSPSHLAALIARICGIERAPQFPSIHLLPDCAITSMAVEMCETAPLRDFLSAKIPPYEPKVALEVSASPPTVLASSNGLEKRVSVWMGKLLSGLLSVEGQSEETYWSGMNAEVAKRLADLASIALVVEGLLELSQISSNKASVNSAGAILTNIAPILSFQKWKPAERAYILAGLDLLFTPIPSYPSVSYPVLLDPGIASGVPRHLLPKQEAVSSLDFESFEFSLLRLIWKEDTTSEALIEISTALLSIIGGFSQLLPPTQAITSPGPSTQRAREMIESQKEDEFGEIRVSRTSKLSGMGQTERAGAAVMALCVRGLVSQEMASSQATGPVRLSQLVDTLLNVDGVDGIVIAEHLFGAALHGIISFRLGEMESILGHLGGTLLPDYRYARDERFALAALRFLECTASRWVNVNEGSASKDFGSQARQLCAWYTQNIHKNMLCFWRVRLRFAEFLDTYLTFDGAQEVWDYGGQAYRNGDDMVYPFPLITSFLSDTDFRVRFHSATSSARLFDHYKKQNIDDDVHFRNIRDNVQDNVEEVEHVLTQVLCNANIIIANANRRRSTYYYLIELAKTSSQYLAIVEAVLKGAADRLSLPDLASLYEVYAGGYASKNLGSGAKSSFTPSFRACGFNSSTEMRKADMAQVGSLLMGYSLLDDFKVICEMVKITLKEGALRVLPQTLALVILERSKLASESDEGATIDELDEAIKLQAARAGAADDYQVVTLVESVGDEIVARMLSLMWARRWSSNELPPAFAGDPRRSGAVFASIFQIPSPIEVIQPPAPFFHPGVVVPALKCFDGKYKILSRPASLFSILRQLLTLSHQAPFIDQQQRLLISICVAISLSSRSAHGNACILETLVRSLVIHLSRIDLAPIVISMLQWAFREWKPSVDRCESLVRAAYAACLLSKSTVGAEDETLVVDFQAFLEHEIRGMLEPTLTKDVLPDKPRPVILAMLLWPTPLIDPCEVPLETIYEALCSPFADLGKFNLVKSLCRRESLAAESWSGKILWKAFEGMKEQEVRSLEDCAALAELLYLISADIARPVLQDTSVRQVKPPKDDLDLKKNIISKLLQFGGSHNVSLVNDIFTAIRCIFCATLSPSPSYSIASLSSGASTVATFLAHSALLSEHRIRVKDKARLAFLLEEKWMILGRSYAGWVRGVACLLSNCRAENDPFYAQLPILLNTTTELSSALLPTLVHSILLQGCSNNDDKPRTQLSSYFSSLLADRKTDNQTLEAIVNLAVNLRHSGTPEKNNRGSSIDAWLQISWLSLAEGAVKAGLYAAALLFLELAHEYDALFRKSVIMETSADCKAQALLYDIYEHLEEPDGFYGRQSIDVREALKRRYHHEARWSDAFGIHGAAYESQVRRPGYPADRNASSGVVKSLASFGFNRLAMTLLQSARARGEIEDGSLAPGQAYELAWRSDTWDLPVEEKAKTTSSAALYSALRCAYASRDQDTLLPTVERSLMSEVAKLALVNSDLPHPRVEVLSTVLALREVRNWASLSIDGVMSPGAVQALSQVSSKFSYDHAEKVLSTRIGLLRAVRMHQQVDQIAETDVSSLYTQATQLELSCLLTLSQAARQKGKLQASMNAVTAAFNLLEPGESAHTVEEEFAEVLWAQREHSTAISLLRAIETTTSDGQALLLAKLGTWTAEARLQSVAEIITSYFEPAIASLTTAPPTSDFAKVYGAFATFADAQFIEHSQAEAIQRDRFEKYRLRRTAELQEVDKQMKAIPKGLDNSLLQQLSKGKNEGEAHLREDEQRLAVLTQTTESMLWYALENYAKAFADSSEHDHKIYRFCAIWLAQLDDHHFVQLYPLTKKIPSHKFVALAYQISARLGSGNQHFADYVKKLITRMASDHPFHTLYPLHALRKPSSAGSIESSGRTKRKSMPAEISNQDNRSEAAEIIWTTIGQLSSLSERVNAIDLACEAYIEWASVKVLEEPDYSTPGAPRRKPKKGSLLIKENLMIITRVCNLPIPVTTFSLPISVTGKYTAQDFASIVRYERTFTIAGGNANPKVLFCLGSDGKQYKQLLKSEDDIRQDAVMEQAFGLINDLLRRDERSRRRRLTMITYKVIPLRRKTGLLEWCSDTLPFGDVLAELHAKYSPGTFDAPQARNMLQTVKGKDLATQRKMLEKLQILLPPVLRHFHFEKQKSPSSWLDMRTNYSRSVAVTSIVGHVVGLGDRHVSNILMDTVRGDLIAIDLGMVFDQSKRLPIPETIPFRLTQNMVDGLGMTGVEGVFRRCAEETLRVLRERASVFITVLEVFKHDPLQTWTVSAEAIRVQGVENTEGMEELPGEADRALAIVADKLDNKLSVEYSVNSLIREATDPENLCRVFAGWQPYL